MGTAVHENLGRSSGPVRSVVGAGQDGELDEQPAIPSRSRVRFTWLVALVALPGVTDVSVAEITADGIRLEVAGEPVPSARRGARAAELRADALRALRSDGLLPGATEPSPGT